MTEQESYDIMHRYFTQPNAKLGKNKYDRCVYRGEYGEKCAVGCQIPDRIYDLGMEDKTVEALFDNFSAFAEYFAGLEDFLGEAQTLHDNTASDARHFIELLNKSAKVRGLIVHENS